MPTLPANPNLDQLRHQAKDLVHAAKRGDAGALGRIQAVSTELTLASAQLAAPHLSQRKGMTPSS
jgi:hypothetical protein